MCLKRYPKQADTKGEFLLERVFTHLNLIEKAYFGLRFLNKAGESVSDASLCNEGTAQSTYGYIPQSIVILR
ncbi:hypothetical protein AVEN_97517-1 [Araneus ventricosus]|uniref:FERM N-terminal domain-containing protein n=1 Tax=Araneus ventricosus TaxID=182803 RepID=A0A4Y2NZ78_ARAVE|nr:hypothetical protein AVEN_97517-1 [Araneus ventricosus]